MTEERLARIEAKLDDLLERVSRLEGEARLAGTLVKYVVLPLIAILGGLIGLKVAAPAA